MIKRFLDLQYLDYLFMRSSVSVMDWNLNTPSEWDWENLAYSGKVIEIPKNLQFPSHETVGNFSFSASVDSLSKEGIKTFGSMNVMDGFSKDSVEKEEFPWVGKNGHFSNMVEEASVLSGEAMIGLKLGRQTYCEDMSASSSNKAAAPFPLLPPSSSSSSPIIKRSRASYQSSQTPRCQVEGCNLDLSSAKDYHRRHRICANHSKSPKVTVAGMERRFCQQCSRFHDLSEFDDRKRSCRRRLSAHNARRRRPQPDDIQFGSARMSSSICDRRPQMSFLMNRVSIPVPNPAPESACSFKVTLGEESLLSLAKSRGIDVIPNGALHLDNSHRTASFHGVAPRTVNQNGVEATSGTIFAPEVRHAFSLLSTSSWAMNGHEEPSTSFDQFVHGNSSISLAQPGMPLELQNNGNAQLQDVHSLKSPHEFECFYSN